MYKYFIVFTLFLAAVLPQAKAQDSIWVRTFSRDNYNLINRDLIETYDHGYLLTNDLMGSINNHDKDIFGQLIKTDINGEKLWEKDIGFLSDSGWVATYGQASRQTPDGGYKVLGLTGGYADHTTHGSVFVMKLNACGEKEWSKIFFRPDTQFPYDIRVLPDNSYFFIADYWDRNWVHTSNTWVIKISSDGNIIWEKMYANWDPDHNNNDWMWHLAPDNNNHYIVIGEYYNVIIPVFSLMNESSLKR